MMQPPKGCKQPSGPPGYASGANAGDSEPRDQIAEVGIAHCSCCGQEMHAVDRVERHKALAAEWKRLYEGQVTTNKALKNRYRCPHCHTAYTDGPRDAVGEELIEELAAALREFVRLDEECGLACSDGSELVMAMNDARDALLQVDRGV